MALTVLIPMPLRKKRKADNDLIMLAISNNVSKDFNTMPQTRLARQSWYMTWWNNLQQIDSSRANVYVQSTHRSSHNPFRDNCQYLCLIFTERLKIHLVTLRAKVVTAVNDLWAVDPSLSYRNNFLATY